MGSHQKQTKPVFPSDDHVSKPQTDKSSLPLQTKKIKFILFKERKNSFSKAKYIGKQFIVTVHIDC